MQLRDDGVVCFSSSDLVGFLARPHLTTLQVAVAHGEIPKPFRHNPHAELIRRKGEDHEWRYFDRLQAAGRDIVAIFFEDRD